MYIRIIINVISFNIEYILKNFFFFNNFFLFFYKRKGFLFTSSNFSFLFFFFKIEKYIVFLIYINDFFFSSFINFNLKEKIKILYENDNIIIINKESEIPVFDFKNYNNFYNIVLNYFFYSSYNYLNIKFLRFVNRIDKETSGIIFCSKNLFSFKIYSDLFKKRLINKFYYGICFGKNINNSFYINCLHGRNMLNRKVFTISLNKIGNKKRYSSSKIILLKRKSEINEIFIKIFTGRTHQIRSHLYFINNFLLGDKKYGFKITNVLKSKNINLINNISYINRLFLHSYLLYFFDPLQDNKLIRIVSSLPFEMKKICSILNYRVS